MPKRERGPSKSLLAPPGNGGFVVIFSSCLSKKHTGVFAKIPLFAKDFLTT
jgi:hypothetical protein